MRAKYVFMRLARRLLPDSLAYRMLSRDLLPVAALAEVFRTYAALLHDYSMPVRGRVIAECGPGTYNSAAFGLLRMGAAKVFLQEPFLHDQDYGRWKGRMLELLHELDQDGPPKEPGEAPGAEAKDSLRPEDILGPAAWNRARVDWQSCPAQATPCAADSLDLILSHHVLEHIPDIAAVFREQMRVLRPGGRLLHVVDLRDHYFAYPLEMLTFSRFAWERILTSPSRGAGFQNRLRADDYEGLLAKAGFREIAWKALQEDGPELERVRPRLHPDFSAKPGKVLRATRIALAARKPGAYISPP
jgi:SAM-dependent methyltransferase